MYIPVYAQDVAIDQGEYIANTTNELTDSLILRKVINYIRIHILRLTAIMVYMLWLFMMQMWATFSVPGWTFIDGLYWAAASLSTGGMWAIPNDSPESYFVIAAAFSCLGIPIMATAFTSMIGLIFHMDSHRSTLLENVNERVTEAEIELLQRFGIDKKDGFFDKKEFIILCAIRLNILMPSVIQYIVQRFDQLDESGSGRLCYATAFKKYHSLITGILASEGVEEGKEGVKHKSIKQTNTHTNNNTIATSNNVNNKNNNNSNNITSCHSIDEEEADKIIIIKPLQHSHHSVYDDGYEEKSNVSDHSAIATHEKGQNCDHSVSSKNLIENDDDEDTCIHFGISSNILLNKSRSMSIGGNCEHIDRMTSVVGIEKDGV